MRHLLMISALVMGSFALTPGVDAQLQETRALTLEAAKQMAAAAEAEAEQQGWTVVVAIVDASGDLILLHRRDGTQVGSVAVATEKARTAARFLRPSAAFQGGISGGNNTLLNLDILPIEGGLPIEVDGQVIGAIGVSGVAPDQDTVIAEAGLAGLSY